VPPNIVFILIDDMGWMDLTCQGSSFYETPNIDQLAKDGMRFTDAYAACPVCSPTRASILTGKYPATIELTDYIGAFAKGKLLPAPFVDHLPLEEKSIATALKEAGYRTYHVGKWHLGPEPYWPEHHGFDVNIGGCGWGNPRHGYFSPYRNPRLKDGPKGEYLTDRLTDEAINLIKTNGDAPFFLYMSHYAVHMPMDAPKALIRKYRMKAKQLGLDKLKTYEKGEKFPIVQKRMMHMYRRLLQSDPRYAAMIENLDTNTGKLLQALKETGKDENTVIIFTSDNGGVATYSKPPTTNAPLNEGKGWMYEGGNRVPLLIKWPHTIAPGRICSVLVTSPDFYPTMLQIAGLPLNPAQHVDGISLLPLLKGANSLPRKHIFWHFPHYSNLGGTPTASIRQEQYKLIEFFEDGHTELYNLENDIGETHDLTHEEPDRSHQMKEELHRWYHRVKARFPTPNPKWKKRWDKGLED
jgi:arylsulfatase A-like enzyme